MDKELELLELQKKSYKEHIKHCIDELDDLRLLATICGFCDGLMAQEKGDSH